MPFAGGQDVIIVCDVSATNPVISDLALTEPNVDNVEFNVDYDEGTGTITITGATAANEGTYTCTAVNGKTEPTTINFVLRMDSPSSGSTPTPTKDSAGECKYLSLGNKTLIYFFIVCFLCRKFAGNCLGSCCDAASYYFSLMKLSRYIKYYAFQILFIPQTYFMQCFGILHLKMLRMHSSLD